MKMKTIRCSILCFVVLLLTAPLLRAQDLSKYRHFTLGMSLTRVLERTDQKMAGVKMIHGRPALIQQVTWWPPNIPVTYDRTSTEGLTAEDMVKSISAKYGPATSVKPEVDSATNERYDMRQKPVATWEDSQYSFNLVRSSFSGGFELLIYSKRLNAEAEVALAEAVKLEKEEEPQREAERQKKQTGDLEATRRKNQKSFHP